MSEISNQKESFISLKTAQSGSDFVGITVTQNEKSITFPMGYSLSNSNLSAQKITKNERKEILNLIKSISECRNFKKGERISSLNGKTAGDFPIKSIFFHYRGFFGPQHLLHGKRNFLHNGEKRKNKLAAHNQKLKAGDL